MQDPRKSLDRRTMLAGAGTAGALAAAAAVLPSPGPEAPAPGAEPAAAPEKASAGYRLTEHVRRYYRTTRI